MVGRSGSLWAGANTGNFSVRLETSKVIKNCLKSALVAEISRIKVPKKGNFLSFHLAFHIVLPEVSEVRPSRDEIGRRDPWLEVRLCSIVFPFQVFRFKKRSARFVVIPGFDNSHSNSRPIIIAR